MVKFIFTSILGTFVFSENYKLLDGLLFKDKEQYKEKGKYEENMKRN